MEAFKDLVNTVSSPTILFTATVASFFFIFPPTDWFDKWHRRLRLHYLWTKKAFIITTVTMIGFFIIGLSDPDFRSIVLKPDNVPISGLIFLVYFFTWLAMRQAYKNDERMEAGEKPDEYLSLIHI